MRRNLLTETEMLPLDYLKSFYQFIFVWRILLIITYYIDMCVCWCHWLFSSSSLITLESVCDFKFVIKKREKRLYILDSIFYFTQQGPQLAFFEKQNTYTDTNIIWSFWNRNIDNWYQYTETRYMTIFSALHVKLMTFSCIFFFFFFVWDTVIDAEITVNWSS